MKKIKISRGSIPHLVLLIVTTALFGLLFYPFFDFILGLLTKTPFTYSFLKHFTQPILFACIFGTTIWVVEKKKTKK
jgi:hypothetical protein